jgi:hypothetical protein
MSNIPDELFIDLNMLTTLYDKDDVGNVKFAFLSDGIESEDNRTIADLRRLFREMNYRIIKIVRKYRRDVHRIIECVGFEIYTDIPHDLYESSTEDYYDWCVDNVHREVATDSNQSSPVVSEPPDDTPTVSSEFTDDENKSQDPINANV